MLDLTILRVMKHKANFDRIIPDLPEDALDIKTRTILNDFAKFFKDTGHPEVKIGPFKSFFFNTYHPTLNTEETKYYGSLLDACAKDVDQATTAALCNSLVELSFATNVGNDAQSYHRGDDIDILGTVDDRVASAKARIIGGDAESTIVSTCITDLLAEDANNSGLQFNVGILRNGLRPLRPSDLCIVAGRPDTGKTSFITSELRGVVEQLEADRPVVWFNNEGDGGRIKRRLYQSFLGASIDELLELQQRGTLLDDYANALNGRAIHIVDCHDWTSSMVERTIQQTTPGLVIFDMIDNIEFNGTMRAGHDTRTDQLLEAQYQWARNLGVKYEHPVIATSQVSADAEASADTQAYPEMHMLKDSKTGKQGAADLIVMIGRSADPSMANARFISTPKNKLSRTGNQYLKGQVNFDGLRGLYSDPLNT